MMENKFEVIEHAHLTDSRRDLIIELKQNYWKHDYESQKKWMAENLRPDDVHILMYDGESLIAYLTVSQIEVGLDGIKKKMLGIGNVCVKKDHSGTGLGKKCVLYANDYIVGQAAPGILLCHDHLCGFYSKCNWVTVNEGLRTEITVAHMPYEHMVMVINDDPEVFMNCKHMDIDRNF